LAAAEASVRSRYCIGGAGFKVQGSKFKVQSSRFKVQGSKFKVQSSRFKVQGSKFKVQSSARKWKTQKLPVRAAVQADYLREKLFLVRFGAIWCDGAGLVAESGTAVPHSKTHRAMRAAEIPPGCGARRAKAAFDPHSASIPIRIIHFDEHWNTLSSGWMADWRPFRKKRQLAVSCS
jgi:hypothetical protein